MMMLLNPVSRGLNNEASQVAGLLAPGSFDDTYLPISKETVAFQSIVPGYSGGSATDLHRLPFSTPVRKPE